MSDARSLPPSGEIVSADRLAALSSGVSTLTLARGFGGTSDPTCAATTCGTKMYSSLGG